MTIRKSFMFIIIVIDLELLNEVKIMKKAVDNKTQEVIGLTSVFLEGVNEYCRFRECNLGSFITDSFVDYVSNKKYLN